ncbi:MAG: BLUF domain-containing protein [Anaerolineae bacterium]
MLTTLIYGSTASYEMKQEDLKKILVTSRRNNEKAHITGMLLYKNKNFLQVLEGEEDALDELYEKIKQDKRHHSVYTIMKRKIKQREFKQWEMGFTDLDEAPPVDLLGYSDFLQNSLSDDMNDDKASRIYIFLKNFRDLMS